MDALLVLVLAAGTWWGLARYWKQQGKGAGVRHVGGFSAAFFVFVALISILATMEQDRKADAQAVADADLYRIVDDDAMANIKRTVNVRLKQPVEEEQLRRIAATIKSSNKSEFQRTFITYRLEGAPAQGMAWATTHYNPELQIVVHGQ